MKKKKGKLASTAIAVTLGLSTLALGLSPVQKANAEQARQEVVSSVSNTYQGAPLDLGIANDERLIEMLKRQGKLDKNASPTESEEALNQFLKTKSESSVSKKEQQTDFEKENKKYMDQLIENAGLKNGSGNKFGQTKNSEVSSVEEEAWNGEVQKDNVLVLLIDFPDKPRGDIDSQYTDMYYDGEGAYSNEHYQNMIFGKDGYTGPNGENLTSMKQYFEEQSGGSYTVDGSVAGWYTAKNPAAYYGGNYPTPDGSDANPRDLVLEALNAAAADDVNLNAYDQEDPYDLNGNGDVNEPDGIIDHVMVIHSGVGEEAGGGELGGDAIWSHSWSLEGPTPIEGTETDVPYWGGQLVGYDYTIEPEDGAAGVFAHEFGHDLGLPDEYDTQYTGAGEPISYWSIMSSGSWAGAVPGTEPTGISPYSKQILQTIQGGNWLSGSTINASDITSEGTEVLLDEAVTKGTNNDAVRVNLPDKQNVVNEPFSGDYEYFSGSGNNLDNSMITTVDLTNASSAQLNFKTWYDIETGWDYASVKVNGESIEGNITTTDDPYKQNPGNGITGSSNGWKDATFDLSAYAGETVELEFNYWTDGAAVLPGFYVDDISVVADGAEVLFDDAEGDSAFAFAGFDKDTGSFYSEQYYLLEWRSQNGVDEGLANIRRGASLMSFDPGLVVWYVDKAYDNNWTGVHPGKGFLGIVDADQKANYWSDGSIGATRYQLNDAAFGLDKTSKMFLDYTDLLGVTLKDNNQNRTPLFDDSADWSNPELVDAGRNVPNFGLKFRVVGQSADGTVGKVLLYK
ncbi:immune inhibitor A [Aquibacillus sp. 3ASR75-11]|uniref:Immune inhibitor A n=1 Tax=Terrihalobacillus insolitus TaxID=2950438 RepID=A0A9X4AP48_9BACI|nr:immune inhibitor A domain-containing protein [Terrihalobacillus insolitus]MDC3425170.1 immune inhibitor A [Terrihalobacillus insolitus]